MIRAEASITIDRPVEEVWRFMTDWDNIRKGDVFQVGDEIRELSEGPIVLGSTVQMKGSFAGRKMTIDARFSEFELNKKLTLEYTSGPFRGSRKAFSIQPGENGNTTKLIYVSDGEFHGIWRILEVLLRPMAQGGLKMTTGEELARISQSVSGQK